MSQQQIKSKIIEYYRDILCREPDKDGLDLYLKMANNGTSLEKIRKLFLKSDEYSFLKSNNYLKYAPSFKTSFSDDEVKKMFDSVDWWYNSFKIGNVENTNTKSSLNYQMWVSSIIPENLENKTVLDIGAADGYYSFLCESRGAKKVVAVDWTEFSGFSIMHKVLNSKVEFRKLVIDDSNYGFATIKSKIGTMDKIKEKFPIGEKKSAIIESLLLLQHENEGHITKDMMQALSKYLSVEEIDVYEIATFYTMLNTKPVGKNVIAVCNLGMIGHHYKNHTSFLQFNIIQI